MESCIGKLREVQNELEQLEVFLEATNPLTEKLLATTKLIFDSMQSNSNLPTSGLKELIIWGLDDEQIWQEIDLENSHMTSNVFEDLSTVSMSARSILAPQLGEVNITLSGTPVTTYGSEEEKEQDCTQFRSSDASEDENITVSNTDVNLREEEATGEPSELSDVEDDDDDGDANDKSMSISNLLDRTRRTTNGRRKKKSEVLDDDFFKLADMNKYADNFIVNQKEDSDEDIDYFSANLLAEEDESDMGEEEAKSAKYSDYFDAPRSISDKVIEEEEESSDDEDIEDSEMKEEEFSDYDKIEEHVNGQSDQDEGVSAKSLSRHEQAQLKMKEEIKQLEEANLEDKPWQEKGEASSKHRPMNSLLEEDLQFQHTSIGGPVITEETTLKLEDIIKQRIKDQAWDDVVRKEKKILENEELKKETPLMEEKSKLSLAEIYEKEYIKSTEKTTGQEEDEDTEEHKVIRGIMKRLFAKLDALSNFHYTPKPLKEDLQIITNVPSIRMEDVAPTMVSETTHLAPEEVYTKSKSELMGKSEKSVTNKKRERRAKKLKKRKEAAEKNKKEPSSDRKLKFQEKKEILKSLSKNKRTTVLNRPQDDKHLKSSSAVFSRLQDEAKSYVKAKRKERVEKKKSDGTAVASAMKL